MIRKTAIALVLAGAALASSCESLITGGPLIREGEPTGIIRVNNDTNMPISVVLISDCNASTYGLNRLPDGYSIAPGRSYDFRVSAGCWDTSVGHATGSSSWVEARQRMQVEAGGGVDYHVGQD